MNINSITNFSFKGNIEVRVKSKYAPKSTVCGLKVIDANNVKSIKYNKDFENTVIALNDKSNWITDDKSGIKYHRALVSAYNAAICTKPGVNIEVV